MQGIILFSERQGDKVKVQLLPPRSC